VDELSFWVVFGRVADALTIIAALVAFFGVLSTWLSRPRVEITTHCSGPTDSYVTLTHRAGSSPLRNLHYGMGVLNEDGIAMAGGDGPLTPTLLAGESWYFRLYDPDILTIQGDPRPKETRISAKQPWGVILDLSWQRPLLPWSRTRRVVAWSQSDREAGRPPVVLKGRAAARACAKAMSPSRAD
jgi:hypothetical protein